MRQTDLNRAVARATGETVDRINRMGFSLVVVPNRSPRQKKMNRPRVKAIRPAFDYSCLPARRPA